jgi:hypothetical protein
MSSVSGLSARHRAEARDRVYRAAMLGYKNRDQIHYTQGSQRWQGIADTRKSQMGQYPNYADCSAFATWCIWNGIYVKFGVRDTVNGAAWKAGYTGTMLSHGKLVQHLASVRVGDCVIYGRRNTTGAHTAIVVGRRNGQIMVVSHGSEGGPFYLPYNYRSDIMCIRRYI